MALPARLQRPLRAKLEWVEMEHPIMGAEDSPTCSASNRALILCWGRNGLDSSTRCCTTLVTISTTRSYRLEPLTGPPLVEQQLPSDLVLVSGMEMQTRGCNRTKLSYIVPSANSRN